jgi:multidrug efflux pump subunit AcrA (membrane-fusion protein)
MQDREEQNQAVEPTEGVKPVDSPSENYLVVETLQKIPSVFSRGLIYLIVFVLLSGLVYAVLGKVDIVAECRAVARPIAHPTRIVSFADGQIVEVFIEQGQVVEEGAPLFEIRFEEARNHLATVQELRQSIDFQREYYDTRISSASEELNRIYTNYRNRLRVSELKLEQNRVSLDSIDAEIRYWRKEIAFLSREVERAKKQPEEGTASNKADFERSGLERAHMELQKVTSKRDITRREKEIIEEEIKKEEENFKSRKLILENEIKNLEREKETTLKPMQNRLERNQKTVSLQGEFSSDKKRGDGEEQTMGVIRAEHAGTISELRFNDTGAYVRAFDLLCTILRTDAPLHMDITVMNKDIGFIEKDMEIKYKFDAFPYTDCGLLLGKVSAISPSATEDRTLGLVYHVHGTLDTPHFDIRGKKYPLKPGMTATAELITGKKSIFSILFRRLKE